MSNPSASIGLAVIGRNEGARLKRCRRSVPSGVPVACVDSASTDGSVEFAHSRQATVVDLEIAKPFSAARARNEGFVALLERYRDIIFVQFVDGDCELEPDWLDRAVNFCDTRPKIAAVFGRRRERYPDASLYNRMCEEEWNTPTGQADACGGDAMIRVKVFEDVGRYDATMIAGEETDLCSRLRAAGWQIWRLDLPMAIHDADMHRFDQYLKRAIRSGFGYAQVFRKTASGGGDRLYQREVARALFWTLGVTFAALLCVVIFGVAGLILAPVIWITQWGWLGLRHGFAEGGYMLISNIAETIGILRFVSAQMRGRKQGAIFYK